MLSDKYLGKFVCHTGHAYSFGYRSNYRYINSDQIVLGDLERPHDQRQLLVRSHHPLRVRPRLLHGRGRVRAHVHGDRHVGRADPDMQPGRVSAARSARQLLRRRVRPALQGAHHLHLQERLRAGRRDEANMPGGQDVERDSTAMCHHPSE